MKLLIVSRRLNLEQSAPKCNLHLALALSAKGVEVHILTSLVTEEARLLIDKSKVRIHPVHKVFAQKFIAPASLSIIAMLIKNKICAEAVLGNGYTIGTDISWCHFPRLAYIKKLQQIGLHYFARLKFEGLIEKYIFASSRALLAPSNIVANDLRKVYNLNNKEIIILPHGVDTHYYKPLSEQQRKEIKRKLGFPDKVIILFVGADPIFKGLYVLLKCLAYSNIKREFGVIALGFKPSLAFIDLINKLGLKNIVQLLGITNYKKLRLYYQAADIIALPSFYESFGLVILEGMACGAVPLVSKYAGVSEIIEDEGFIIDPLNRYSIEYALEEVVNLNKHQRLKARIKAEKYSWLNIAQTFISNVKHRFS